jgi:ribonuclease VapC
LIVVDSSSLIAILQNESGSSQMMLALARADRAVMGAPTKLELMMVSGGRAGEVGQERVRLLLAEKPIEIVAWTDALADIAATAFLRYGKGRHPAALNFGDCMAYALAKSLDAPLLYKGDDFAKTDILSALA